LPWIAKQNVSTHWLRYTTLTWVERNFGQAIARGYAGHSDGGPQGVTAIYVRPTLYEIATALSGLTGEHHPLARLKREPNRLNPRPACHYPGSTSRSTTMGST
jgi:hypothetical protein